MSYLVLARKWRPKVFAELVGQEHVVKALTNALDTGRLHHAFLFAGTRGVGKTTIARILAKSLNCEQGVSSNPCGACDACREIDEGRFIDLLEVDAASRTKVDDTRELLENVQYSPTRGRYKVYLIDEVHMLSNHSFNALLKTLEEPPPHVKFLLATTDPQKLPITVLSRCLQFNLKRLSGKLIENRLSYILGEEGITAEPAALQLLSRAADGSMRDALSLLDQLIAFGDDTLTEQAASEMLGTLDKQHLGRLMDALTRSDAQGMMEAVGQIDELVPDYARILEDMAELLQRAALSQAVPKLDNSQRGDRELVNVLASGLSPEDVQLFYQIALIGRRDLDLAPDPKVGFEMVLLRMLAFRPSAADEVEPAGGLQVATRSAPAQPTSAARSTTAGTMLSADTDWNVLVENLDLQGAPKQLANHCVLVKREGKALHLQLDAASEHLLTKQLQEKLRAAFENYFQEPTTLVIKVCEPGVETPARQTARKQDERLKAARAEIESDPNVQALQEAFGATVQADSVKPTN